MIDKLKKSPKSIAFTEGTDPRILEASSRLLASTFLRPILIGKIDAVMSAAEEAGYNVRGAEIIDPDNYDRFLCIQYLLQIHYITFSLPPEVVSFRLT